MNYSPEFDIAVAGGGLAGLAAATFAARAGRSVVVFEKAPQPGGRASTQCIEGFHFNQGPHALYRAGEGAEVLRELGIQYSGSQASYDGSWALRGDQRYPLPGTPDALQRTELLSPESRAEVTAFFASLSNLRPEEWDHLTFRQWLDTHIQHPDAQALIEAFVRLSTYCDDAGMQSAGAALRQTMIGRAGVDYLDGGWQALVELLKDAAVSAGVEIVSRSPVERIDCDDGAAELRLANGTSYRARAVISTIAPAAIARVVNEGSIASLNDHAERAIPVYAACLDVALRTLPHPGHLFAIGVDRPLYYSVHTRSAKLAPASGAVIHVAKYLSRAVTGSAAEVRAELEATMDALQPGWRNELVTQRFLPRMLVSNAVVTASEGGAAGRPRAQVPEMENLFLAGDWVGPQGMLADASLASAREAATQADSWLESSVPNFLNAKC